MIVDGLCARIPKMGMQHVYFLDDCPRKAGIRGNVANEYRLAESHISHQPIQRVVEWVAGCGYYLRENHAEGHSGATVIRKNAFHARTNHKGRKVDSSGAR